MNDSRYTVENLILGTDNLDKMVRDIRFVVDTLMRYVREEAASHDGWNKHYNVSWRIGSWAIIPVGVGEICLDHQSAGRIWNTAGRFQQPNVFHVLQVRKDLQILLDAVIERHPVLATRLAPFIEAASI